MRNVLKMCIWLWQCLIILRWQNLKHDKAASQNFFLSAVWSVLAYPDMTFFTTDWVESRFFLSGWKQIFFVIVWSVLSHPDVTFFMIDWVESSASVWWESTICKEQSLCSHCYWHCQRVHLWIRRVTLDVGVQGKIPLAGPKHDNWYWSFGC